MKHLSIIYALAAVLLLGFVVSPVAAVEYHATTFVQTDNTSHYYGEQILTFDHDASAEGDRVTLIYFTVPSNSRVDFTLYYGFNQEVDGYVQTELLTGLRTGWSRAIVNLNGVESNYSFFDINRKYDIDVAGYAKDSSDPANTGFLVSSDAYGLLDNNLAVFYAVPNIDQNLIYKVSAVGTQPFSIKVVDDDPGIVAAAANHSTWETINGWIDFALSFIDALKGYLLGVIWFLQFFTFDNLLLVIALYLSVTMAYSAISARGNIFKFYKNFFGYQRKFIEFMIQMWNVLVQIVSNLKNIFLKFI